MIWTLPTIITSNITRADTDAEAFISASGVDADTYRIPLTQLVQTFKGIGFWSLCNAIWPFIGTTSTTQKFNLKDPRDLDAAYRITFSSGWTFASTGATSDGAATTFANTHLIPSTASLVGLNNAHLSIYSRTAAAGSSTSSDIGSTVLGAQDFRIIIRRSNNSQFSIIFGTSTTLNNTLSTDGRGMWMGSRTASNVHRLYKNGGLLLTSPNANTDAMPNINTYIGATNFTSAVSGPTAREYAFSTVGAGVSTTMQPLVYNAIQNFQRALGRNV